MKADDREHFTEAMGLQIDAHSDNEHWELMKREDVPRHHKILSAIWAMKRKRCIATSDIYKWTRRTANKGHPLQRDLFTSSRLGFN